MNALVQWHYGHFGIREICDICPAAQLARCASAHRRPEIQIVEDLARTAGLDIGSVSVDDRRIEVVGSSEQQRYFVQHSLNYQVHDRSHPHLSERHGRAEFGWE
jgi:hypothetical protein